MRPRRSCPPTRHRWRWPSAAGEAVGDPAQAEQQYVAALKAQPRDGQVMRTVAVFFLRVGKLKEAEDQRLRAVMASSVPADAAWGQRNLAITLAGRGDFTRYAEALALVGLKMEASGRVTDTTAPSTDNPLEERRTQALVLAARSQRETRRKAIEVLEKLRGTPALTPEDQFLLGQMYETNGNWDRAHDVFRAAAGTTMNPQLLAYYAQALLRQRSWSEADTYIGRLEKVEADRKLAVGDLGSVELKVQRLEGERRAGEAIALLSEVRGRAARRSSRRRCWSWSACCRASRASSTRH